MFPFSFEAKWGKQEKEKEKEEEEEEGKKKRKQKQKKKKKKKKKKKTIEEERGRSFICTSSICDPLPSTRSPDHASTHCPGGIHTNRVSLPWVTFDGGSVRSVKPPVNPVKLLALLPGSPAALATCPAPSSPPPSGATRRSAVRRYWSLTAACNDRVTKDDVGW